MGSGNRRSRWKRERQKRRAISDSRVAGHGLGDFQRSTPSYDTESSASAGWVGSWMKWKSHRARLDFAAATPGSVGEVERRTRRKDARPGLRRIEADRASRRVRAQIVGELHSRGEGSRRRKLGARMKGDAEGFLYTTLAKQRRPEASTPCLKWWR
ncbi:hypothetical protein DL95DRAFT_470775 [Leptodontidium sp. 2 PMI_412]|nr:hypothetical protein DL95DRAFT_470775 [Leptodontidium sp. 2 PMI_412]